MFFRINSMIRTSIFFFLIFFFVVMFIYQILLCLTNVIVRTYFLSSHDLQDLNLEMGLPLLIRRQEGKNWNWSHVMVKWKRGSRIVMPLIMLMLIIYNGIWLSPERQLVLRDGKKGGFFKWSWFPGKDPLWFEKERG